MWKSEAVRAREGMYSRGKKRKEKSTWTREGGTHNQTWDLAKFVPRPHNFCPLHTNQSFLFTIYPHTVLVRLLPPIRPAGKARGSFRSREHSMFLYPGNGWEPISVGLGLSITYEDSVITTFCCHPFAALSGGTISGVIGELLGHQIGSMHIFTPHFFGGNGIVGAKFPSAPASLLLRNT